MNINPKGNERSSSSETLATRSSNDDERRKNSRRDWLRPTERDAEKGEEPDPAFGQNIVRELEAS